MSRRLAMLPAAMLLVAMPAEAQWRAEASVAARAARATSATGALDAPPATPALAGAALAGGVAWSAGTRGPWQVELVGTAGHEGLAARSGGDVRAVARLAWSRGGPAGLHLEGGGVAAWRLEAAGARRQSGGDSALALGALPARVRGATTALGGWARVGRVLLSASARTTGAGAMKESYLQEHRTIADSVGLRGRFDSLTQRWSADTVRLGPMTKVSWTQEERRRPIVLTDVTVDAATSLGAFAFSLTGGVRHGPPTTASEGWAAARASLAVRQGLGITLQAARLASDPLRALPARRELQLGIQLRPRGARGLPVSLPAAASASARRFVARLEGDGHATLTVEAPGAQTVEVMGDFTSWRIVPLVRDGAGRWRTTLPLTRGVHQLNLRIDGGAWLPPPGLGVGDDGFGGRVGVLVL